MIGRPQVHEHPAHFQRYMDLVPEEDVCAAMAEQLERTSAFLQRIPDDSVDRRYAPGKWTTREVVGHILDTERIFGYRLLTFARGDEVTTPRADENLYVRSGDFSRYPLADWIDEFALVRRSHMALLRHLAPDAWRRMGNSSIGPISVRAMAYLMLGHERHHLGIIRDKYLATGQ